MMDKRWYIVHAYSNFEKRLRNRFANRRSSAGSRFVRGILVPTEKVVEVRRGRKIDAERKFFPGYVLVKMDLTDEAFHLIKNTPKVTGFLGADDKPMPISEAEADAHPASGAGRRRASEAVGLLRGRRAGARCRWSVRLLLGRGRGIDEARSRVKVAVSIFGRATPVELEFGQVEKI